jgi:small-conductance mechanosensitive channel
MKTFFNSIKIGIKNYFKTFETNTLTYLKVNAIALIVIIGIIITLTVWLYPAEKNITNQVYAKNEQLSNNFDSNSQTVIDQGKENNIQSQIETLKSDREKFQIIKLVFYSIILTFLTGLLATFLQLVYTKLKFTKDPASSSTVLSAALFSACLIVCVVYIITYFPSTSITP